MSNTITIELCAEDRKRIDELICFAGLIVGEMKEKRTTFIMDPLKVVTPAEEHPVDAVSPHGEPEPVAEPELPQYTKEDVLAKVQQLAAPNNPNRAQVKTLIKSYGAKVSDIPVDKYAEVMAKLAELEG